MCNRWFRYVLLAALGVALGLCPAQLRADDPWSVSGNTSPTIPLPVGPYQHDGSGFYTGLEFVMLHQSRALGGQTLAYRGYIPSFDFPLGNGFVGGVQEGSFNDALKADELGRTSWAPGSRLTAGYRAEDGSSYSVAWTHLNDNKYSGGAGPQGGNFRDVRGGDNQFLFSPVYNFSPLFSGAPNRILATVPGVGTAPVTGLLYGIWNGASEMTILLTQRFDNWDVAGRFPVFETENARSYAIAGGRLAWIWERFQWRTANNNIIGDDVSGFVTEQSPEYAARYVNTLSQRMYGPMLGAGHEVYLGSGFGLSLETTFSPLVNVAKERAKYIREDEATQAKRSLNDLTITLNANVALNMTWQPTEGITFRLGYNAYNFFNTYYMKSPVGFNVGAIDPAYETRFFRLLHGFNAGVAYTW